MKRFLYMTGLKSQRITDTVTENPPQRSTVSARLTLSDLVGVGFCQREVEHLRDLQQAYQTGALNEETRETQLLAFARWLYIHNYLGK